MADITERTAGRPLIIANKNGGTDCYGSFEFREPFEEPESIGWRSRRDDTGAYRVGVNCPIYKDNGGHCIDGVSPCTAAEFIRLPGEVITVRGYSLDVDNFLVSKGDNSAELTGTQTALLRPLMRAPGVVFSRESLHTRMPSHRSKALVTVDQVMSRTRRTLVGLTDIGENVIESVAREGYLFIPEQESVEVSAEGYILGPRTISYGENGESIGVNATQHAGFNLLMSTPGVIFSRDAFSGIIPPRANKSDNPITTANRVIKSMRNTLDQLPGPGGSVIVTIPRKGICFGSPDSQ